MQYYACPQCNGREFIRLEVIKTDSKGIALKVESAGIFRCGTCNARISIDPASGAIAVVQVSAKATTARPQLRSSVSTERRFEIDERKF